LEDNPKPLDLGKFKDAIQHESARMHLNALHVEGETSFTLALALSAAIKKIFYEKSEMVFSSEPKLEKKNITQFVHRMRVDAMEKFNAPTVFAAIQFAADQEDLEKQAYLLTLTVYLEKQFLPEFMRLLQYPYFDYDNEAEVKDGCGTLANLVAGQYKREMIPLGYKDLMMSPFESYINVVDLVTLDLLPKRKAVENSAPKRILIVDDDVTQTKTMEAFLQTQGFEVLVANDGEEGLKKLRLKPDLVVLDIQMPVMDGYEFIVEKKNIEGLHQIPVIVLTARDGMMDMFKIEGAREYMLKPFQPTALLRSILRYI
jgi:CheY-like chemotaxis protein